MYEVGDTLPFSSRFYNPKGALVNAFAVSLAITQPDGSVVEPNVTNPPASIGDYQYDHVTTDQAGQYVGRWLFTTASGLTSAYTETFEVSPGNPRFLVSLAAAKAHLNIPADDASQDEEIRDWLTAVTEVVEDRVGPCLPLTVTDEWHDETSGVLWLRKRPVLSITSITSALDAGATYLPPQVYADPSGRVVKLSGRFYGGPFRVTYVAGRQPMPRKFRQAALIILQHLWETQRGPTTQSLNGGDDVSVLPGYGFAVPNRALELLGAPAPQVA